ncbi:hypothetical protein ACQ859_13580 [Roseateles chitinivorans]|uniref:hypothetical protein n=1 Tax=Roseateles chitinivorans TaxID=2917965 RepID=UPI003D67E40F
MSAVLDPAQTPLHRAPDQMGQALLLAVLLHVLLLVAIGNAPGGSAKPGEGAWGPLNVRLQGDRYEPGSGEPAVVLPERGPVGEAKQPRSGGAVRERPPTPEEQKTPGAARQGQWRQQPGDELTGDAPADRSAPPAAATPAPAPNPKPAPPAPTPVLAPTPAPTPAPTAAQTPSPLPAPAPAVVEPAPAVTTLTTPVESTVAAPTRIAPTARETAPARPTVPTEALQAPSPTLQLPERPAPLLSETPTTVRRIDRSPIERTPTPPVPTELKAPAELPPLTAAPAVAPQPAPTPTPAPPVASPAPTPAPSLAPTPPAAATPAPSPTPAQPRVSTTPSPTPTPANRISLDGSTTPTTTQPSVGAPDAGARTGHDVATPASTPPNAPKLNLDMNAARGPMRPRGTPSGVISAVPKPPEDKDALAEKMREAGQQECRKAYADKGLLAVVPLVRDAARDKGCRW